MPVNVKHTKAARLRALHVPGNPVVLPNAWDAASARAVESAGFAAIATSSAAVSGVLGYADGEATPATEMLAAIGRIARAVTTPVTADLERGYGLPPDELVERLAASGAVGCNLEDSDPRTGRLIDPAEQADFLAAVRDAADRAGFDLVVNARVDSYLAGAGDASDRLADATDRARRYLAAGADCVYPILLADAEAISALTRQVTGPVNILSRPGVPEIADLARLGVARVSFGSGLHDATLAWFAGLVAAIQPRDSAATASSAS